MKNGIVTLNGRVLTSAEKHLATRYAGDVQGVVGVVTLISVQPGLRYVPKTDADPPSTGRPGSDHRGLQLHAADDSAACSARLDTDELLLNWIMLSNLKFGGVFHQILPTWGGCAPIGDNVD